MFPMKYLFYFNSIYSIIALLQTNLYFTNQVSENEYNDQIGIRYNCFRLASYINKENLIRAISSYCLSESALKFPIENDTSLQTFSFTKLEKMNITKHCWQLEFIECQTSQYVCDIGECIPSEFVRDDENIFDCVDRSDEKQSDLGQIPSDIHYEPAFGYDDIRCENQFLTSSCLIFRHYLIAESMFSVKDESISDKCWLAFKCYFGFPHPEYPEIDNDIYRECIPTINETCPDILYIPNIPVFFGHIYTAFKNNYTLFDGNYILPYLCSNKSFTFASFDLVSDMLINNTMCFDISQFASTSVDTKYHWMDRYFAPINEIYRQIEEINSINNFSLHRCNESNLYQCLNSSKCISFHRIMNDVYDCPYYDDENIFEDKNPQLFAQLQYNYYKCHTTNKYISLAAINNQECDCGYLEDDLCEDENELKIFIQTTIPFQTICDRYRELYPITINGKNETDETECELWECNNIYTRCDNIWNCFYGEDEIGCDSTPSMFNCSSDHRICVTRDTSEFSCLPTNKINDGQIDCLGGTDEPLLCRSHSPHLTGEGGFYCRSNDTSACLGNYQLCNDQKDCPYGDDEQFCQKNRSITLNVEKFLRHISMHHRKMEIKHFTIQGFHESFGNEEKDEEILNVVNSKRYTRTSLLNNFRCHRGLDLRVWLNKSSTLYTSTCLCPPSYYGNQCQYQNQRVSLAIRFHASAQSRQTRFAILTMLIDDTNQRIIHSYEQFTYLSIRDCKIKFNLYLLYSTRPKHLNRTYSIHIDIYEKSSLTYRGSFLYPVKFFFLPVHRLAFIVNIPSEDDSYRRETCSDKKCLHGKCINYFNTKETFCQCEQGWSGQHCDISYNCTCSLSNSLCIGLSSNNRSICMCQQNYFGPLCYLRNQICESSPCENKGSCIPHDDLMLGKKQRYFCICPKGYSGKRCEVIDTQIELIFDSNIHLSHSIFIHFIKIVLHEQHGNTIPKPSPARLTTLQTISQETNSIRIYWSHPFHLTFIETLDKKYYLAVIQPIYNYSTIIIQRINSSHRCPSINELINQIFSQLHVLHRIKSYHLICQQYSPHLQCFHDDTHLCLCYDYQTKRLANCFYFNHAMKFDCFGQNHCENDGQCFQDSSDCPKRSICMCPSCYYGSRCQFSTSEFGLSLDAILAYHIIPNINIFHQTSIIKISFSLTIIFMIVGLINDSTELSVHLTH
ncbi:hypothetical protein I4U23_015740 [Adineta vaga]|nr:hypothetical protein I4U23_015740 [Adineta vaga]